MTTTVPEEAARWIVGYVDHHGLDESDLTRHPGIKKLLVKELKLIWKAIQQFMTAQHGPSSHSRKAVWVSYVRRAFYEDDECTIPNTRIVALLPSRPPTFDDRAQQVLAAHAARVATQNAASAPRRASPQQQSRGGGAAAAAAAHSASVRPQQRTSGAPTFSPAQSFTQQARASQSASAQKPQSAAHSSGAKQIAPRPAAAARAPTSVPMVAMPQASAAALMMAGMMPQQSLPHQNGQVFVPYPFTAYGFPPPMQQQQASMPPPAPGRPAPASAPTAAAATAPRSTSPQHKEAKQPPPDDPYWETNPRTPQESNMAAQLRQMGFTDMREILAGVRHVSATEMSAQVDAAMMWIVSQREEAEDARQLDAARLRSEELRAEQARKRKKAAHDRLWSTSLEEWLSEKDLFRGSIVLKETKSKLESLFSNEKQLLIDFLKLEKKAFAWYENDLPWCYFCNLANGWKIKSPQELVECVRSETKALEHHMYSLSEQVGGVPKVFIAARSRAEESGLPTGRNGDSSKEGIVVVKTVQSPTNSCSETTQTIIEIL